MDTVLQPHESHTNYVLQWMMDYNLQGMNPVNCITLHVTASHPRSLNILLPDPPQPRPLQTGECPGRV